jgi:hypothetical protein
VLAEDAWHRLHHLVAAVLGESLDAAKTCAVSLRAGVSVRTEEGLLMRKLVPSAPERMPTGRWVSGARRAQVDASFDPEGILRSRRPRRIRLQRQRSLYFPRPANTGIAPVVYHDNRTRVHRLVLTSPHQPRAVPSSTWVR